MKLLYCSGLFFLFVRVASLQLVVQPQTVVGSSSLVVWKRDPSDPADFTFDLRFISGFSDKGLARANIQATVNDVYGTTCVVFNNPGAYTLQAVSGTSAVLGSSRQVTAIAAISPPALPNPMSALSLSSATPSTTSPVPVPVSSSSATATGASSTSSFTPTSGPSLTTTTSSVPVATNTPTNTTPRPISASAKRSVNLPAVVGGILGGLVFLGLLVAFIIFMSRRRKAAIRRYTFHKDMMVQSQLDDPSVPRVTIFPGDMIQGRVSNPDLESGVPPPLPPKLVIPSLIANSLPRELDRPHSPMTPRTKRNFFGVTATSDSGQPLTPKSASLHPPNTDRNPFTSELDSAHFQPLRMGSLTASQPSPKGPRPSIKRPRSKSDFTGPYQPAKDAP